MSTSAVPMMSLQQAQGWLAGSQCLGAGSQLIHRVHTDTRSLQVGDLFVALQGERFDANNFLAQAQAAGAAAAICTVAAREQLQALGLPALLVSDTKRALADLAAGWRAQFDIPLIAVTGSNGKTTVTQMIGAILRAAYAEQCLVTQGNLNNDIGVPLTLLRLRAQHVSAVVELGMNHPGEIAQLAAITAPSVALVNNAQREHQEFMTTVQAVALENASVWRSLRGPGVAVFPADDTYTGLWTELAAPHTTLSFALAAENTSAAVAATRADWRHDAWQVQARTPQGPLTYRLAAAGLHNVRNSLAALACTLTAGVPLAAIAQGLSEFRPVKGRSHAHALQWAGRALTLVDDSYNANPDSVRAAIDLLASLPGPHLLVLGDMGEVGAQGPQFHAEVGHYAAQRGIEQLYTLGALASHSAVAFGAAQHFQTVQDLSAALLQQLPHCASVLVKGSRFMKMEQVVAAVLSAAQAQEAAHAA